jgi:hypothetical protein
VSTRSKEGLLETRCVSGHRRARPGPGSSQADSLKTGPLLDRRETGGAGFAEFRQLVPKIPRRHLLPITLAVPVRSRRFSRRR